MQDLRAGHPPASNGDPDRLLRLTVWCCAAVACLTGTIALAGWFTGNDALKGALIANITIKANTAACLLLAGLSLALLAPERRGLVATLLGRVFAATLVVVGLTTLGEHLFHWNLGIDQILFREVPQALATAAPNRMGPPASSCFPLLGASLLLLDVRGRRGEAPFQIPTVTLMAIALVSLLGYLFQVRELYGIAQLSGIAFHTAFAFLLLGVGLLCSRPHAGFMRRVTAADSGGLVIRRMLPPAIVLPVAIGWLRTAGENAGLYPADFGRVLTISTFMIVFASLTWWTGRTISRQAALLASARHAALASERRFRSLVMATSQIVWSADPSGTVVEDSPSWSAYTGQSHASSKGWGWLEAIHPDDREGVLQAWQASVAARRVFRAEYRVRRRDGEWRWMMVRAVPVFDGADRLVEWVGACTEMHDVKLAQDALREADRRKDEFLATLSHELRNPLAPIRNAVEYLKARGPLDVESQWSRDVIERQVEHMARLLDDLLDVSRITRNRLELRRQPASIGPIVQRSLETSRPLIEAAHHHLTVTMPESDLWIEADPLRLAQVISNLLNNAARYTEPGGHIALDVRREGSDVVITVKDDGIGIAPAQLTHVFEMFAQAAPALHRSQGGLGIGLALVRGIVEGHGGRVEARSDGLGRGSEFLVRLPAVVAAPFAPVAGTGPRARTSPPLRILVADDQADALESLTRMLQLEGHEVHRAHDGLEAVERCERFRPDVALLDIGMPRMNGFEAARRIRAQSADRRVRLIALTGWGQPEDRRRATEAGFDHHLVKPVEFTDLVRALQPALPSARAASPDAHVS